MVQSPLVIPKAFQDAVEPAVRTKWDATYVVSFLITIVAIIWGTYKAVEASALRFLSVPPHNYRELIEKGLDKGSIPDSSLGVKKGAIRRRLILAANKPQLYSTMKLNKDSVVGNNLRLAKVDKDDDGFLARTRPMDPDFAERPVIYGFFHPYSDANGGGERVLWDGVYYTLKQSSRNLVAIYTFTATDEICVSSILRSVRSTFGVDFFEDELNDRIVFIQLNNKYKWLVEGKAWKHFTIVGQALGSVFVVLTSLYKLVPDVFIDTMGLPFSYPVVSFLGIPVIAYVHYPLISSDMLNKLNLWSVYGWAKWVYWKLMMEFYEFVAQCIDITLCNSTWTCNHIKSVWSNVVETHPPKILYPSTGIDETKIASPFGKKDRTMLYLAQFRPEKRHGLLIEEYAKYLETSEKPYKLVLVGSTRTAQDEETVVELKELVKKLDIEQYVVFEVNAPRDVLDEYLSKADFGLNTMWNEHFGIAVVEYLFNGAIPIVHASAGPLLDIVLPVKDGKVATPETLDATPSGFFFADKSDPDYTGVYPSLGSVFDKIESLSETEKTAMRAAGHLVAEKKFSKSVFGQEWTKLVQFLATFERFKRKQRNKVELVY